MPDLSRGIGLQTDAEQLEASYRAYKALSGTGVRFSALNLLGLAAQMALVGDERAKELVEMASTRIFNPQPQVIEALSMVILGELERTRRWSHKP
ncbi:MAG TPA: hypothetical protein VNJ87_00075 [Candidatus Macondimonas sp.]|nr:hypothetical protein [Candidatus Macondimonas sp.]